MDHHQRHKKYWDKVAKEKKFTTPFQIELFSKYVSKNSKILDIGCGYGRTLNELYLSNFKNIYGIDFSKEMISRGKHLHPHLNLRVQESKRIPFENEFFDAVILLAVLTSVIDNEEQTSFIQEVQRVLKPGGIVYINDFLLNDDLRNIERYNRSKNKYKTYGVFDLPDGATFRHHDIKWIKKLLSLFSQIKFHNTTYITMNGNEAKGFYYLGRKRE